MTQRVAVDTILSEGRAGAIFTGTTADGARLRFVAFGDGMARTPVSGEVWEISGTIRRHPRHGRQVHVETAALVRPSGRLIVAALARGPAFPGIGAALAQRLLDELGDDLVPALDRGDGGRLATIVGPRLARVLIEGWMTVGADAMTYDWLDRRGITPVLAGRVIEIYGTDAPAKLGENPYRLLAFVPWKEIDRVGRALGVPTLDPRRLVAAAEASAYERLEAGDTWTRREDLAQITARLLDAPRAVADEAVTLAVEAHALVETGGGLQPLGPWSMERYVAERVTAMASGNYEGTQPLLDAPDQQAHEEEMFASFGAASGVVLNEEQRQAVAMALKSPLSILEGGAGVGKTTALRAVHELAKRALRPVWQMALSGRAAKRMQEATGRPATTIAAFLQRAAHGEIDLDQEWLLVIDEASMLDLPSLYRIMRAMRPGNRLLLVGDPGQLPPIGFGLTFHALAETPQIPRTRLVEIHRQAASTGIPQASLAVRHGRTCELRGFRGREPGVQFIDAEPGKAISVIMDVVDRLGGIGELQVLAPLKSGAAGTRAINADFHQTLAAGMPELAGFCAGEPVLWTANDYDLGLMNGSLGRVLAVGRTLQVAWDDGRVLDIGVDRLANVEHAYGITCHKAQGSQFRRVVIPVFRSRLLDRTLLYTAITRAQEQVVLIGDRAAFLAAVAAPPRSSMRSTGMTAHLRSNALGAGVAISE